MGEPGGLRAVPGRGRERLPPARPDARLSPAAGRGRDHRDPDLGPRLPPGPPTAAAYPGGAGRAGGAAPAARHCAAERAGDQAGPDPARRLAAGHHPDDPAPVRPAGGRGHGRDAAGQCPGGTGGDRHDSLLGRPHRRGRRAPGRAADRSGGAQRRHCPTRGARVYRQAGRQPGKSAGRDSARAGLQPGPRLSGRQPAPGRPAPAREAHGGVARRVALRPA